jgi:hypothetical protein
VGIRAVGRRGGPTDSFEQVVSELLWNEGLSGWRSFKVKLTAEDKAAIGKPSSPRWELDVVAYDVRDNVIHVIECKSYFDNPGVGARWLKDDRPASRVGFLELFADDTLRKVVFARLEQQLVDERRRRARPKLRLGLVCGHTKKAAREELRGHFAAKGWDLYDEEWLRDGLRKVANGGLRESDFGRRGEALDRVPWRGVALAA